MINIREYEETDAEPVMSLIRQLQAHEVAIYDRMKPVADMGLWYIDLLKKQCAKDDGVILIAEENGLALGYATILTNVIEDGSADEVAYRYAHVGDLVVVIALEIPQHEHLRRLPAKIGYSALNDLAQFAAPVLRLRAQMRVTRQLCRLLERNRPQTPTLTYEVE